MWKRRGAVAVPRMHRIHLAQFRLEFLENTTPASSSSPTARSGGLAYKARVGNKMDWYSSSQRGRSGPTYRLPGNGFAINVFLRRRHRVPHLAPPAEVRSNSATSSRISTSCRGDGWNSGRTPRGWPQRPVRARWAGAEEIARHYGEGPQARRVTAEAHPPNPRRRDLQS